MSRTPGTAGKAKRPRAVSYLRVSGKSQVGRDGFPRQRSVITRWANRNGVELVEEFQDAAVSGTKDLQDREGLGELLDRLESNGVHLVLVESASRIARDLLVSEVIIAQLRERGVGVIACDSGQNLGDDDDPTRVLIRQVLGAVSQFEKSVLVSKLAAARLRKRRETGRCEGVKPYGATPAEQRVLRRIRELRRKPRGKARLGYDRIAAMLNAEGHATRRGGAWRASTVGDIVRRHEADGWRGLRAGVAD